MDKLLVSPSPHLHTKTSTKSLMRAGFNRITEKPVHHQKRKYGVSKFGLERFVNGFLDLVSLWFLSTFGKKPMHFFGFTGILMFIIGGIMAVWIIAEKLIQQGQNLPFRPVTEQPLFYLALVAVWNDSHLQYFYQFCQFSQKYTIKYFSSFRSSRRRFKKSGQYFSTSFQNRSEWFI